MDELDQKIQEKSGEKQGEENKEEDKNEDNEGDQVVEGDEQQKPELNEDREQQEEANKKKTSNITKPKAPKRNLRTKGKKKQAYRCAGFFWEKKKEQI